jgi:hypothetical protein
LQFKPVRQCEFGFQLAIAEAVEAPASKMAMVIIAYFILPSNQAFPFGRQGDIQSKRAKMKYGICRRSVWLDGGNKQ